MTAVVTKPKTAIVLVVVVLAERQCRDKVDLTGVELRAVVALIAARAVGRLGATRDELLALTGVLGGVNMSALERRLWIHAIGRVEGTREIIWAPYPRAAGRLELAGWTCLLFAEDELDRVDPNLPGFLPHRDARLGPAVVDTTGETVAERRSA